MKNLIILLYSLALFSCSSTKQAEGSKSGYTVIANDNERILKGYINRSVIENDTSYKWFKKNLTNGTADAGAVEAFRNNAGKFNMVVFGGTWCEDTQALLPVFYRLVSASGYPERKIKLIAVDRAKIAPDDLHKTYNVTNVPTFIVMKDGKEVGRVVEYGKQGKIDKELGEIVMKAVGK